LLESVPAETAPARPYHGIIILLCGLIAFFCMILVALLIVKILNN
jgi:hypothetical protein